MTGAALRSGRAVTMPPDYLGHTGPSLKPTKDAADAASAPVPTPPATDRTDTILEALARARRWTRLSGPVWQRFDGLRIHTGSLLCAFGPVDGQRFVRSTDPAWVHARRREPRRHRALIRYADDVYPTPDPVDAP